MNRNVLESESDSNMLNELTVEATKGVGHQYEKQTFIVH